MKKQIKLECHDCRSVQLYIEYMNYNEFKFYLDMAGWTFQDDKPSCDKCNNKIYDFI